MRKLRVIFGSLIFLILGQLLFVPAPAWAFAGTKDQTQAVTIVNPIRGKDFWSYQHGLLDTSTQEYKVIAKNQLPATWLVRFDALTDPQIVGFLKSLNSQQEVGLFLEVTPSLTTAAGVTYHQSPNWHYAQSILLAGYTPVEREKLIDTAVAKYKEIFGVNPKSVGSWWIDAYSLNYLKNKYSVEANLDVADQYSTDQYQVWGQYFSTPFYPSKLNALMPAQSAENKIGVVTIQWATRDPVNSYGNGVGDSTYSVQANDYMLHNLGVNYFQKLLDIYPQVTVGLENDFDWKTYGTEYQKQIELLAQKQQPGFSVKTMSEYAAYYKNAYPNISPNVLITADDPLGGSGKVVWYQTPKYRVGWFVNLTGSVIRDLRIYNDSVKEECYDTACSSLNLAASFINAIDNVTYGNQWVLDEGTISNVKVSYSPNSVQIQYINQAGKPRSVKFLENDIQIDDKIQTIPVAILFASQSSASQTRTTVVPTLQNVDNLRQGEFIFIDFGKFLIFTLLFFFLPGWVLTRKILLAIPVGWSLFTLVSFVTGFLHQDLLLWAIPVASVIGLWKTGLPEFKKPKMDQQFILLCLVITLGSFSWLLTTFRSGLLFPFGMGFWGPNGHDAIWHLGLISELQRNFPPQNPFFAGVPLTNYHYFFDLLLAKSGSLFSMDSLDLLFRVFPLVFAGL